MKLAPETITAIIEEFKEFKESMYAGKSLEERKELDQFFTPPTVTISLLESLTTVIDIDILDPCSGSGNLLMACIIAGADPERVYGNDYDAAMVTICRDRLNKYCKAHGLREVPYHHIHRGNALQKKCLTNFDDSPEESYLFSKDGMHYQEKYIDDLQYAQSDNGWRWENARAAERLKKAKAKQAGYVDLFGGLL
jgi:type I restriction-modification system DNA methylase subunit